ncbi:hypothetical protein MKW94_024007 [Papaver nudicaule]|uniref:Uncharacterized protein n=1 Tax=Papaver nudicaule TaxID=74823 RepID=A0AA41UUS2_PAPNU|nr:hypothetical protein [Papaver nudicaule]
MKGFGLLPSLFRIRRVSLLSTQKYVRFSSSLADSPGGESLVYKHKLLYQRPDTIEIVKFQQPYYNSVSFIGSVLFPPRLVNSSSNLGAYTWLQVKYPKDPETNFRIFLSFWNKMAEISMQHVQKNDTIYVSGRLGSMTKVDLSGNEIKTFKLAVNELNFVENYPYCEPKESEEPALKIVSEDGDVACPVYAVSQDSSCKEEKVDRLRLWQIFFANPREWRDNRERKKKNPKLPDFSHKYTNEALWFKANDPSWVRRQIEQYDSEQVLRGLAKSSTRKRFGEYLG